MPHSRRRSRLAATGGILVASLPLSVLLTSGPFAWLPTPCLLRACTGVPCPLCGLTHAFAAVTRLQWGEATSSNALWPVALALILTFAALLITDAMTDGAAAARLAGGLLRRWRLTAPLIAAFWLARLPMS